MFLTHQCKDLLMYDCGSEKITLQMMIWVKTFASYKNVTLCIFIHPINLPQLFGFDFTQTAVRWGNQHVFNPSTHTQPAILSDPATRKLFNNMVLSDWLI